MHPVRRCDFFTAAGLSAFGSLLGGAGGLIGATRKPDGIPVPRTQEPHFQSNPAESSGGINSSFNSLGQSGTSTNSGIDFEKAGSGIRSIASGLSHFGSPKKLNPADEGARRRQFLNAAYPGTNPWEQLGASGSSAGAHEASAINRQRENFEERQQSRELQTREDIAKISAKAQVQSAGISSGHVVAAPDTVAAAGVDLNLARADRERGDARIRAIEAGTLDERRRAELRRIRAEGTRIHSDNERIQFANKFQGKLEPFFDKIALAQFRQQRYGGAAGMISIIEDELKRGGSIAGKIYSPDTNPTEVLTDMILLASAGAVASSLLGHLGRFAAGRRTPNNYVDETLGPGGHTTRARSYFPRRGWDL